MKRAESGGRADDNLETLRKRFKSYEEIQLPIINIYKEQVFSVEKSAFWSILPSWQLLPFLATFSIRATFC